MMNPPSSPLSETQHDPDNTSFLEREIARREIMKHLIALAEAPEEHVKKAWTKMKGVLQSTKEQEPFNPSLLSESSKFALSSWWTKVLKNHPLDIQKSVSEGLVSKGGMWLHGIFPTMASTVPADAESPLFGLHSPIRPEEKMWVTVCWRQAVEQWTTMTHSIVQEWSQTNEPSVLSEKLVGVPHVFPRVRYGQLPRGLEPAFYQQMKQAWEERDALLAHKVQADSEPEWRRCWVLLETRHSSAPCLVWGVWEGAYGFTEVWESLKRTRGHLKTPYQLWELAVDWCLETRPHRAKPEYLSAFYQEVWKCRESMPEQENDGYLEQRLWRLSGFKGPGHAWMTRSTEDMLSEILTLLKEADKPSDWLQKSQDELRARQRGESREGFMIDWDWLSDEGEWENEVAKTLKGLWKEWSESQNNRASHPISLEAPSGWSSQGLEDVLSWWCRQKPSLRNKTLKAWTSFSLPPPDEAGWAMLCDALWEAVGQDASRLSTWWSESLEAFQKWRPTIGEAAFQQLDQWVIQRCSEGLRQSWESEPSLSEGAVKKLRF